MLRSYLNASSKAFVRPRKRHAFRPGVVVNVRRARHPRYPTLTRPARAPQGVGAHAVQASRAAVHRTRQDRQPSSYNRPSQHWRANRRRLSPDPCEPKTPPACLGLMGRAPLGLDGGVAGPSGAYGAGANVTPWLIAGAIGGLITAVVLSFKPVWAAFLAGKTSWSRPWSLYVLNEWCRRHLAA